jgi:hypothetical protein
MSDWPIVGVVKIEIRRKANMTAKQSGRMIAERLFLKRTENLLWISILASLSESLLAQTAMTHQARYKVSVASNPLKTKQPIFTA